MTRKGQAALEFLSTYGFAFLIILVMIGALWYFGIFDAEGLLPEQCNFPPEFGCDGAQISGDGSTSTVEIYLVRAGRTITLDNSTVVGTAADRFDSDGSGNCQIIGCPTYDSGSDSCTVSGGEAFGLICDMAGTYPGNGDKVRSEIQFTYREAGGRFDEQVSGTILENYVRS